MSDIFISYAHSAGGAARRVADALRARGHAVWWDEELLAHHAFSDVIEERLRAAKAVVVLWSADAAKSQWVRAEADIARTAGTLVQVRIDDCALPLPFNQVQCVDLIAWDGDQSLHGWRKVMASVMALMQGAAAQGPVRAAHAVAPPPETLLAVLAFDNLSNDPDLAYFSDGVSEEILFTVARTKGLRVIGKASSFQFRGPEKNAHRIASALGATHMLDGSVRRAGGNIRISAELVDTASLETLWSDRFDRALTDIFALQDEIAAAIAEALDHHFAPARKAVSIDPVAYDLYLRARAILAQDLTWADQAKCAALLEGAVSRAPDFAQAWGRLAAYRRGDAAVAAAQRGLRLDPNCAASLAALARNKPSFAQHAEKLGLIARAYMLTPDDQLVSGVYVQVLLSLGLLSRAIEVADASFECDPLSPMIASSRAIIRCYAGKTAEAIEIAEGVLARFPNSGYAKFVRGAIAIYDGDLDRADAMAATMTTPAEVQSLQSPIMFIRVVNAMDAPVRAAAVRQFLHRAAPKSHLIDIGLAAVVGEVDAAMDHLLETIAEGRPLSFTADNDGRDPTGATVTIGLFVPLFRPLRGDPRFAEVCVRLGLYDCWRQTGDWPDFISEAAPYYDLKAECEKLSAAVAPYVERTSS